MIKAQAWRKPKTVVSVRFASYMARITSGRSGVGDLRDNEEAGLRCRYLKAKGCTAGMACGLRISRSGHGHDRLRCSETLIGPPVDFRKSVVEHSAYQKWHVVCSWGGRLSGSDRFGRPHLG